MIDLSMASMAAMGHCQVHTLFNCSHCMFYLFLPTFMEHVSPQCRLMTLLNSPPLASRSDPASRHFRNSRRAPIPKPNFDIIHIHNQNNILQYRQYPNWNFPVMTIGPRSAPDGHLPTILIAHHRRLDTSSTRQWIDPTRTSRNTCLCLMRPFTYMVQGPPIYSLLTFVPTSV